MLYLELLWVCIQEKCSWVLLLRRNMEKAEFCLFYPIWSKIMPMVILKLVICHFFYGNPILTQIEASVKWGKKWFPPIRTLKIYSCFVRKKIWLIFIYPDLNLYRQGIKIELNVFLFTDSSRLPLWKTVKYIQYLF